MPACPHLWAGRGPAVARRGESPEGELLAQNRAAVSADGPDSARGRSARLALEMRLGVRLAPGHPSHRHRLRRENATGRWRWRPYRATPPKDQASHTSPARRRLPRLLSTVVPGLRAGLSRLQSRWLWEGCGGMLPPGPFSLKLFSVAIYPTAISH